MHRPQDAFTREAGLLGNTLRREIQEIGPKLEPSAAELVECPAGDEVQGARRQAASARVATHPVADLSVSLVTDPAEAHAAEDAPCPRLGHGKGSRGAVVPPGRRLVDPRLSLGLAVGLRDRVQPAGDLLVAVDTLDQRGNVPPGPWSERHDPIVEKRVRHGEHAPRLAQGSGGSCGGPSGRGSGSGSGSETSGSGGTVTGGSATGRSAAGGRGSSAGGRSSTGAVSATCAERAGGWCARRGGEEDGA